MKNLLSAARFLALRASLLALLGVEDPLSDEPKIPGPTRSMGR